MDIQKLMQKAAKDRRFIFDMLSSDPTMKEESELLMMLSESRECDHCLYGCVHIKECRRRFSNEWERK